MVRTEGSTVGEGVPAATSRSMTLFCNLMGLIRPCRAQLVMPSCHIPIPEPGHAFSKITPSFKLWIGRGSDFDVGQSIADEGPQVLWKATKGVISTLSRNGESNHIVGD